MGTRCVCAEYLRGHNSITDLCRRDSVRDLSLWCVTGSCVRRKGGEAAATYPEADAAEHATRGARPRGTCAATVSNPCIRP